MELLKFGKMVNVSVSMVMPGITDNADNAQQALNQQLINKPANAQKLTQFTTATLISVSNVVKTHNQTHQGPVVIVFLDSSFKMVNALHQIANLTKIGLMVNANASLDGLKLDLPVLRLVELTNIMTEKYAYARKDMLELTVCADYALLDLYLMLLRTCVNVLILNSILAMVN